MFADGERAYRLTEDVRRLPACVVGSVTADPGSLIDLLAVFRSLRDNHSQIPRFVVPYLGYARQDKSSDPGETAVGVMIAEILRNANPAAIAVVDPNSMIAAEALGPSAQVISAIPLFADELQKGERVEVVVAPDEGATARAMQLASRLGAEVQTAWIEKSRPKANVSQAKALNGDVKGKHVVIFDDMIDTGGTMIEAVRIVSKAGALSIRLAATHGLFSKGADERLARLPVQEIFITNTLPQPRRDHIRVLDISPLLLIT